MGIQQATIKGRSGGDAPPPPILGLALTSGLYPVVDRGDSVDISCAVGTISMFILFPTESVNLAATPPPGNSITMGTTVVLKLYEDWPVESVDMAAAPIVANPITLVTTLVVKSYTDWPPESVNMSAAPRPGQDITMTTTINFINNAMQPESVDMAAQPGSITLV